MSYRYDEDLEFLREMSSEDLNDLVEVIVGKKDDKRLTETLSVHSLYKKYYPDHKEYVEPIMEEIQTFGGNTFANIFRGGKEVLYREILCDVAKKLKVEYDKAAPTRAIEESLYCKIMSDALEKMSDSEVDAAISDLGLNSPEILRAMGQGDYFSLPKRQFATIALQLALRGGGLATYKVALIIANTVWKALFSHGLSLAANAALTRALSVAIGPIGWILTGLWTAVDMAGAAYRVTVPAVIQVACLRLIHDQRKQGNI